MAWQLGGKVAACDKREYGHASLQLLSPDCPLFLDLPAGMQVWMSHGDQLQQAPADFHVIARTDTAPFAAVSHANKPWYGIQFHPEVTHTPLGKQLLGNFVLNICSCTANWTMV
jgi:GMP synthase (glutamine-hydrolysing)